MLRRAAAMLVFGLVLLIVGMAAFDQPPPQEQELVMTNQLISNDALLTAASPSTARERTSPEALAYTYNGFDPSSLTAGQEVPATGFVERRVMYHNDLAYDHGHWRPLRL